MKHAQHRIIFGLQSPRSEFYTVWCHQTYINLFQKTQLVLKSSSLPAFLSIRVQHLPSTWGCSGEPPPQPTCQTGQECLLHLKLTDGELTATSGETQEICVVFQTNPTETRITAMLSQSVICQNLPGAKQLCSCTLKSLPEVHATVNTSSARGTATANKNVKNTQKRGEN